MLRAEAFYQRREAERQRLANIPTAAPHNTDENVAASNTVSRPINIPGSGNSERQQPALRPAAEPPTIPTQVQVNPPVAVNRIVNLDAGGGNRWANGEHDFGEEPEEESVTQVWACHHNF